tara:strand:+ start:7078 stop:7983 length:906 start_codon:yes stop_codon:yes gene_type:complete
MAQITVASSMTYFTVVTAAAFLLKYFMAKSYASRNQSIFGLVITVVYLAIIFFIQLYVNYQNAKEKCGGTPQLVPSINYTIIPNLFIFGTLLLILILMPGWKAPFSNTIGYLIVWLAGVNGSFFKILKQDNNQNKLLQMVYKDPSMMINEITPENFDLFIARMGGKKGGIGPIVQGVPIVNAQPIVKAQPIVNAEPLPKPSAPPMTMKGGRRKQRGGNSTSILSSNYKQHIPGLYNFVVIKDMISEFLWYVLVGNLVINTSSTYISSIKCNRSADQLGAFVENSLNNPKMKKKEEKWSLGY